MRVSLILDADAHIKTEIADLRQSLTAFDYEFIVIDRGSPQRIWLAQQGDTQLITVNDDRDVDALALRMARHEDRLIKKGETWRHRHDTLMLLPPTPQTKVKLREARRSEQQRILHISSFPDNTQGISAALDKLGEKRTFNWRKRLDAADRTKMNADLESLSIDWRPDTIFMEECFTGDVLPQTIRAIKSKIPVAVANWNGDARAEIPQSMVEMAKVVDWTLLSNEPQVRELLQLGFTAAFLPAGCDTTTYKTVAPDRDKYPADIVFLGSHRNFYPLDELRQEMAEALYQAYGDRFRVYGRGWPRKTPYVYKFAEPAENEVQLYNSCKVAVGISAFAWDGYTSARMWKAMGSGACYLPHYFPGVERWFKQHEQIVWWRKPKELISIIDYLLQREDERQRIAQTGQQEVIENHSWDNRMTTMMRLMNGRKVKVF